jgi:hypothetical protein
MVSNFVTPGLHPTGGDPGLPHEDRIHIHLYGDERAYYLPTDAPSYQGWALRTAFDRKRPVYVETTDDDVIRNVGLPKVGRIRRVVRDADGTVLAEIDSAAQWLKLPGGPDHVRLLRILEAAQQTLGIIMVALADEGDRLIHAVEAPVEAWYLAPKFFLKGGQTLEEIPVSAVSSDRIDDAFAIVQGGDCRVSASTSCIPFDYPDTGCEARAHEMCRLLADDGFVAGKVWIFDEKTPTMRIATQTCETKCTIGWAHHVAVYLRLKTDDGPGDAFVLDPALFDKPIQLPDFLKALNMSPSRSLFSDAEAYAMYFDGLVAAEPRAEPETTLDQCRRLAAARNPQPPYCTKKL